MANPSTGSASPIARAVRHAGERSSGYRCAFVDVAQQLVLDFLAGGHAFFRRDAARPLLRFELAQAFAVDIEIRVAGGLAASGRLSGEQRTQKHHQSDRHQSDREEGEGPHRSVNHPSVGGGGGGRVSATFETVQAP